MNEPINDETYEMLEGDTAYKPVLLRGISGWAMNFAFTFTAVNIISSYSVSFSNALTTGGPVLMIWGWIIVGTFSILVGLSLAEICSNYPSAGSVYYWSGMLANEKWAPFFSYLCGWFNFLGNTASNTAFASGIGSLIAASASFWGATLDNNASVGIGILMITAWSCINILSIDKQAWLNSFAAFYQISSSLTIIIVLLSVSEVRNSPKFVFTEWNNDTGWENMDAYVICLGLLTTLFAFSGYEAGGQIAEETQQPHKAAPRGIVVSCITAAILGLTYVLGLLFAIPNGNINAVLYGRGCSSNSTFSNTTDYNTTTCISPQHEYALMNLFELALGPIGGFALTVLVILNVFFAGITSVTVTARIGFAMARDGAFPGSEYLQQVNGSTKSPVFIVLFIYATDVLLMLLQLCSTTAFTAIVSLTTIGLQISYAIPIWLRITQSRHTFPKGAFSLGWLSIPIGTVAASWLTITSIVFVWPFEYPVTAMNMNYTSVVVAAVGIIASLFWIFSAQYWFTGPKRQLSTLHADEDIVYF